jgi:hypothetical protein
MALMYSFLWLHRRENDPVENCLGVSGRIIIVPEKAIIQRDSQLVVAQHYDAAKCRNGVGVEMN